MEEKRILRNDNCPHKRVELIKREETVSVLRGKGTPLYKYRLDCYDDAIRLDKPIVNIVFQSKTKSESLFESESFKKSYVNQMVERFWGDYLDMNPEEFTRDNTKSGTYYILNENDASVLVQMPLGEKLIYNKFDISTSDFGEYYLYLKPVEEIKKGGNIGVRLAKSSVKIRELLDIASDSEKIEARMARHIIQAIVVRNGGKLFVKRDEGTSIENVYLENFNAAEFIKLTELIPAIERFLLANSQYSDYQKYGIIVYNDGEWALEDTTNYNVLRLTEREVAS